jgi:hypothetical protein
VTVIWEGLPFLDVSGGLVHGRDGAVLVDTGTTPSRWTERSPRCAYPSNRSPPPSSISVIVRCRSAIRAAVTPTTT